MGGLFWKSRYGWLPTYEKIIEIEIERLRDFKEHPFQVKDDEEMRQLKDSISE